MLPLLIAGFVAGSVPSYVGCTSRARFVLLGPTAGEKAPTNSGLWFLEHVGVDGDGGRPRLIDDATQEEVEVVERTTPLLDGLLLELRPEALQPEHRYRIEVPSGETVRFETEAGPDERRPGVPRTNETDLPGTTAHCHADDAYALTVTPAEPGLLHVAIAGAGDVAVTRRSVLLIPSPREVTVVSMDLAGNRSRETAKTSPPGGCRCAGAGGVGNAKIALALLLPLLLLVRASSR